MLDDYNNDQPARKHLLKDACDYLNKKAKNSGGKYGSLRRNGSPLELRPRPAGNEGGWAFPVGGTKGLQFNFGFEHPSQAPDGTDVPSPLDLNKEVVFRHCVGFCLVPGRQFPSVDVLSQKIKKFNDYLEQHPQEFSDCRMWAWDKPDGYIRINRDSSPHSSSNPAPVWNVGEVPSSLQRTGVTIFMGKIRATTLENGFLPRKFLDEILADFDRFAPLYIDGIK